jgi:hypothetical protein
MISVCEAIKIISSYNARKTNDECGTEKKSDYDPLAERKIEFEYYRDWDEDNEEIRKDVDNALD